MIDWTKPLETYEGVPCRLLTVEEMRGRLYGSNPDEDGDYWLVRPDGYEWCVGPNGLIDDGGPTTPRVDVRNVA